MGIYDSRIEDNVELDESVMMDLERQFFLEDLMSLPANKRHALAESPENAEVRQTLLEKGMINKTDLLKLSRESDMTRRTQLAALALARQNNDPLYQRYAKAQKMKLDSRGQIVKKYGSKAKLSATKAQRDYLRKNTMTSIVIR